MNEIYYYTGKTAGININNREIKLIHINKKYANKNNKLLELILSSAYYLGKENFTLETIHKIEAKLTKSALTELHEYIPVMPQWLATLYFEYYNGGTIVE